jgi:hypothetical protein
MRTIAALLLVPGLALAGGKASGKVIGKTLEVKDALAMTGTGQGRQPILIIGLTNSAGLCDREKKGQDKANSIALVIQLNQLPEKKSEGFKAGDYGVFREGSNPTDRAFASAWFTTYDDKCSDHELAARTGKITLTAWDGKTAKGSFELDFGEGETLKGDFDAPKCDAPENPPSGGCQK